MKRKLDANDLPSSEAWDTPGVREPAPNFENFNLDPRLRQALKEAKFLKPTLVQSRAIPLALEGKDILGRNTTCVFFFSVLGSVKRRC
jgi:ATP-dependent RNA helicase DDX56/DBP9